MVKQTLIMENLNEILEHFKSGREDALGYYHNKHFTALYHFTNSIVKQDDLARDIVSNSFFKLWNNRMKIDKPQHLIAYLFTAAKNESFTYLDKVKREVKHLEKYKYISEQFEEIDISEFERTAVIHERLYAEINRLPKRCRLIVICTFLKGMSNHEIAKQLKISVNTIKNQKTKGLKVLRSRMRTIHLQEDRLIEMYKQQERDNPGMKMPKLKPPPLLTINLDELELNQKKLRPKVNRPKKVNKSALPKSSENTLPKPPSPHSINATNKVEENRKSPSSNKSKSRPRK